MKKGRKFTLKRILAGILAVALICGYLPADFVSNAASYGRDLGWYYSIVEEKANGGYTLTNPSASGYRGTEPDLSDKVTVTYTPEGSTTATTWAEGTLTNNLMSSSNHGIVTITAAPGYYVSYVVLACGDNRTNPFNCRTAATDNAFGYALETSTLNKVELKVSDLYAHSDHTSRDEDYYLMIMLEELPNPVYVSYNAGIAGTTTITAAPVDKSVALSGNGEWLSRYYTAKYVATQADGTYVTPDHTAMDITQAAIDQAANVGDGYTFGGWKVEYYREYTETATNNYPANTFYKKVEVGDMTVAEGDNVKLYTHAVLTAIWVPKVTLEINKVWDDNNNQDGIRPADLDVNILADGSVVDTITITGTGNNWSGTWIGPKQDEDGQEITYTVQEAPVDGYSQRILPGTSTKENTFVFNLSNVHTPETLDINVAKSWNDNYNQDGIRPSAVELELMKNGVATGIKVTLNHDNNWQSSFTNLPKFENGVEIEWAIRENNVKDGYKFSYIIDPSSGYYVAINTHEVEKTSVSVSKVWDDSQNNDGKRPGSVIIKLFADNADTGKTLTLNEVNGWTGTFTNLDKNASGKPISYTIEEVHVPNYTSKVEGNMATGFTVTNTYQLEKTSVSVHKVWDDGLDQDGKRPVSIQVSLLANSVDTGKTVTLNSANNWKASFTELNVYDNGEEIKYTVSEAQVEGYETPLIIGNAADGYTITNKRVPETIAEYTVLKKWEDANNQDGKRPEAIEVHLLANGEHVGVEAVLTLNADNQWKGSWKNLPVYKNGEKINYTVVEVIPSARAVTGYMTTYEYTDVDADGKATATITNTRSTDQTSVTVAKIWRDNENQDGLRPESITVQLYKRLSETTSEKVGEAVTITAGMHWEYTWSPLDLNEGGKEIEYFVEEIGYTVKESGVSVYKEGIPSGYEVKYSEDEITGERQIINTHTPEKTSVNVNKVWADNNNAEGLRPDSVQVQLMVGNQNIGEPVKLSAENNWQHTWTGLPKNAHGRQIDYTVVEITEHVYYTTQISDPVYDAAKNTYNIVVTNSRTTEKFHIDVTKVWDDANNQDGLRQDVVITLVENGVATENTLTLDAKNGWKGSFKDLQAYKNGQLVTYTISEKPIEGYTTVITGDVWTGFTVTNTHEPEKIHYTVKKEWADNNNQDGLRPESITVHLLASGHPTGDVIILNKANNWTATLPELPKYKNGTEIIYHVTEEAIEGYTGSYEYNFETGVATITNTHTPETTSVVVFKIWEDEHNRDGIRPKEVVVSLLANGKDTGKTITITKTDAWVKSFRDLPKYENGKEIEYTVAEKEVDGYTGTIVEDTYVAAGDRIVAAFDITNTHVVETTSVTVTKVWDDENNKDNLRPERIVVQLLANGEPVATVGMISLSEVNQWTHTWTGLKANANGEPIEYTIEELYVAEGYTVEVSYEETETGLKAVVTNTHEPVALPEDVSVNLEALKELIGRNLTAGEFTFEVKDAEGNVVATGKNDADGKIIFSEIKLNAGEYTYTVYEVAGEAEDTIYDKSSYKVKVEIADADKDGVLEKKITYPEGGVKFINEHYEGVDTGDNSQMILWGAMAALCVVAVGALLVIRKKMK